MRTPRLAASPGFAAALLLVLMACTGIAPTPSPSAATPSAETPSAASPAPSDGEDSTTTAPSLASLVSQAVDEGRLDEVTGLLYRAYGLLGLPGLPEEFASGVPRRDESLFSEMTHLMRTGSADDRALLHPFLVRPTEPDSIFADAPTAFVGSAFVGAGPRAPVTCMDWADSGAFDARFRVWACRDRGAAAADADIATIAAMIADIWGPMTKPVPEGMGQPLPDGYGANISDEFGGDARIDFYALELGQVLYRDGPNRIAVDAAASEQSSPPYTNEDGSERTSSSGFVMLNRARMGDPVDMKLDLIHEFFHVLQDAHNLEARYKDRTHHWFVEASATWAETYYMRSESARLHSTWFTGYFQASRRGLESTNKDHEYSAYIWPLFMEQEKGASAVFKAWAAIDSVSAGDFKGVTEAISSQLSFDTAFRDFAVRNLNLEDALTSAELTRYWNLDTNFIEDVPPYKVTGGSIVPESPYRSGQGSIQPLAAAYFELTVAEGSREVTVSLAGLSPSGQFDGDAIVHRVDGTWQRRPLNGGKLKFCRDDPGDDIDSFFLVVSNHGTENPVTGVVEASAKESCAGPNYVGGTITWNAEIRQRISPDLTEVTSVSGSAQLVLLAERSYGFTAERGGGSTYTYDYSVSTCTPTAHLAGTLETSAQSQPAGSTIGNVLIQGAPGQDLAIALVFNDEWEATCFDFTSTRGTPDSFFGCTPQTWVPATFDGVDSYNINCESSLDVPGLTITGHVSGNLHPIEGPEPTP